VRFFARECCQTANDSGRHCEERSDEAIQSGAVKSWIASLALAMTKGKKGSGTPADVVFHDAVPAGTAARHEMAGLRRPSACGRARLSAFHHGACGSDRTPPLSSSHALPGTGLGRDGCYPPPAVLRCSGFPRRPVIMPAGRICPEPPGSEADNPARGNRLAPTVRRHPAASLWARFDSSGCN
jgi:hypothetical protein